MSYNFDQHPGKIGPGWILLATVLLLLLWAFGMATWAVAQKGAPATPALITPPPGNRAFLAGHAVGTQGYICLPTKAGVSWTVNGSRPEATLFAGPAGHDVQIMSHFLSPNISPNEFAPKPLPFGSPTWQSSSDSSRAWGQTLSSIPAGSDPSCPNTGAIGCLLLQAIGSADGPKGGKMMTRTTFIQRLNTEGGTAPAAGCSVANDVGKQALVPYSADYFFFRRTAKAPNTKSTRYEFL